MRKLLILLISMALPLLSTGSLVIDGGVVHGPRIHLKNGASTNWSGYAVETNLTSPQNYAVNDVKGTWVVPIVAQDTINAYSSNWVGIDGYSDGTVEQIGTEQDWNNGSPRYYAWYEMYPKWSVMISNLNISPGDTMTAEVQYVGNNKFMLSITDVKTGQSFTTTQKASAKRQSAEWIVEAPSSSGGILPLANFGTAAFTSCSANGRSIGDTTTWQNDAITMVSSNGLVTKAMPSGLYLGGTSFSDTWYNH